MKTFSRDVIQQECDRTGLTLAELISKKRGNKAKLRRLILFWRIRTECQLSYTHIGILLSRDHTTIRDGVVEIIEILARANPSEPDVYLYELERTLEEGGDKYVPLLHALGLSGSTKSSTTREMSHVTV